MIIILKLILLLIIGIGFLLSFYIIKRLLEKNDYWFRICKSALTQDYYKWILSDKYIAKLYAKHLGFDVPKTYQIVSEPQHINFKELPNQYVIKPLDLCDSTGVYLINNNINKINNKKITSNEIIQELHNMRLGITQEYYMYYYMYNGKIPCKGYIVEELLLDNQEIPYDYKCYVFGGRLYFIAITFDRQKKNNKTVYKSVWMTRNWEPIYFSMCKKNYYYRYLKKPNNLENLISKVEYAAQNLQRHCRIDVYNINEKIYLGEFTFFCGAFLHTFLCNTLLGIIWELNPDKKKKITFLDNIKYIMQDNIKELYQELFTI